MSDMNTGETAMIPATCLDMTVIASLRELGGEEDPDLLTDLIDAFLDDSPSRVAAIAAGGASSDGPALQTAAHGLKSSAANIGAVRLSELCQHLETAGQEDRLDGIETPLEELKHEYSLVEKALMDLRNRS